MPFYLFFQMGSFGNFMFLAFNYLYLIRVGLNRHKITARIFETSKKYISRTSIPPMSFRGKTLASIRNKNLTDTLTISTNFIGVEPTYIKSLAALASVASFASFALIIIFIFIHLTF